MSRFLLLPALLLAAACTPSQDQTAPPTRTVATPDADAPAGDIATGRAVYQEYCASCHGADLAGGNGGTLLAPAWDHVDTDADLRADLIQITAQGLEADGMPAFADGLSDDEIVAVTDFVLAVRAGTAAPQADGDAPVAMPDRDVLDTVETLDYEVAVEAFADGLDEPWAFAFLDARTALITEKGGALRVVRDGVLQPTPVAGTPGVWDAGQGGLLDVTPHPDYAANGWVYLAYSHEHPERGGRGMTRVVRGKLTGADWDALRWTDEQVVFEAPLETYRDRGFHYGTRVVFDADGFLYFAIGDRGVQDDAQRLDLPNGKVYRLRDDGTIPPDNPFTDDPDALPGIYTYGNRNPQGLTVDPQTGAVWAVEHGPRGGDELNRIEAGVNYGWPVITYGINYNGTVLSERRRDPDMAQPVLFWRPSIAVAGAEFYTGALFPFWRDQLLVTALAYEEVRLLTMARDDRFGDRVMHQEVILEDFGRVREAVNGPDGAIYVVTNDPGRILRLAPRGGWDPQ